MMRRRLTMIGLLVAASTIAFTPAASASDTGWGSVRTPQTVPVQIAAVSGAHETIADRLFDTTGAYPGR